jgi:tRNA pseudouridine55 synthase
MTSHDIVAIVRRTLRQAGFPKIKVGHAGTLDPDATGVLLVCIGSATRLADLLADQGKSYHCEFTLGVETSTEDWTGERLTKIDSSHITQADIESKLPELTGTIMQIPPMVSAVHHEGKRLYELARAGVTVEREARPIEIKKIELTKFTPGSEPKGELIVECGKGTYIRTLCTDLGKLLGVGGHMSALCRLSVGVFKLDQCIDITTPSFSADDIQAHLISASEAVSFLPARQISDDERDHMLHGRTIPLGGYTSDENNYVRLIDSAGELVALGETDISLQLISPKKVLSSQM